MNYYKAFLFSLLVHGTSAFGLFIASKYLSAQTASLSPTELHVNLLLETPAVEKVIISQKKKLNKPTASKESTTQETTSLTDEGQTSAKMNIVPDSNNPTPSYPEAARKKHLEGEVLVELTINQSGDVVDLRLMETQADPILCERAIETLKKWKFRISNPSLTPIKIQVPVKFNLH